VFFAEIALYRDIQASGNGTLIADFKAMMTAIQTRTGVLVAIEKLGSDLLAVGTNPAVLADLLRLATDLGLPVPVGSVLRTGKPAAPPSEPGQVRLAEPASLVAARKGLWFPGKRLVAQRRSSRAGAGCR
jgi:hypothetical protein